MSVEPCKRADQDQGEFAAFGPFRLFHGARLLEREGVRVELGGRALDILMALVEEAGKVVSKTDLMASIWPDTTVVEGVLRVHVCNLRKALGDGVSGARYITSVAGRGYCFVAPVVRHSIAPTPSRTADGATGAAEAPKFALGLPPPLARMAGREKAVQTVAAQVLGQRFVTILGAAGIGKTTVAVAVAHALAANFDGAVYFVELGSQPDPALVAATVASSLGMRTPVDDALAGLQAFLQDKRVLLLLDNCEHVVQEAARLAEYLFDRAPQVHLLATSREALRVEGERIHRLGPLETPPDSERVSAAVAQTFPAIQVFLERAAAGGWNGDLTEDDAPVVAAICKRLDGIALAIELAASFVGECGLQDTAAMLDDRLSLLWQQGRRSAPPRQQTLHALVAWSCDRLPPYEHSVLLRSSVLVGTFTLDAAKAVALQGAEADQSLLDALNELVAKSLLSCTVEDGAVVYRMLETTRFYAVEQLAGSGEFERVSLRHASFFASCVSRRPFRERPSDLPNVRAALTWCFSSPSGYATGVGLTAAAAPILLERALVSECHERCRQALSVITAGDAGTPVELALLDGLAASALYSARGIDDGLRSAVARGLELARAFGAHDQEVRLLGHLNRLLIRSGDWKEAVDVAERAMAAASQTKPAEVVRAHWLLALSHHLRGDHARTLEHCEAGLRLAGLSTEPTMIMFRSPHATLTMARALWLQGRADQAVAVTRAILDDPTSLAHPVDKCMALCFGQPIFVWCGQLGEAQRLADMLRDHVERYALTSHRGAAMLMQGELQVKAGRPGEGCRVLRLADTLLKSVHNASRRTYIAAALAEGLAATGALDEALEIVQSGIDLAYRTGGTWDLPELLRIKGCLLASTASGDMRAVDETFSMAVEIAKRQGALAWELRATTALARERLKRGGSAAGLRELAAVYARFTEGFETRDLQEARDVLRERVPRKAPVIVESGRLGRRRASVSGSR